MRSNRKKEWSCILCDHRYEAVSLGETCPRDGGVLLEAEVRARHKNDALLGKCIEQRYQLIDVLGIGGFGTVYRCFDTRRKTEFAFKTIADHKLLNQSEVRQRFLQEGRLLAKLDSAYVVKVHETGEADDTLYMVLELVKGLSLKQYLTRKGQLPLEEAVAVTEQVLIALEHSHNAGLIHRDLKPSNILFTDLDAKSLKLIDFGIAKPLNSQGDNGPKTRTGLVIGTVQYMAPEQLRTDLPVGPQADLYATGILFYEILSGKSPFSGSQAEVAAGHLYQKVKDLDPDLGIPDAVNRWLQIVLSKEPNERFSDALSMRMELRSAVGASVQGLKTTLPVADDTVKMAPDLPFMRSFGLTEIKASAVGTQTENKNQENIVTPAENEVPKPMVSNASSAANRTVEVGMIPSSGNAKQAQKQGALEDKLRQSNEDTIQNIVEPKATQKLTPIELMRASLQSQKSMSVGALIPDEDHDEPGTPMTGNTQLEDVPEALLGYGSAQDDASGGQKSKRRSKETISDERTEAPQAEPSKHEVIAKHEEELGIFKVGVETKDPPTSDSLFSGFTGWWMLPIFLVLVVGVLAVYLW